MQFEFLFAIIIPFQDSDTRQKNMTKQITSEKLDELIEEAIVDCHDDEECLMGFWNMLEENLVFPFSAKVIGEEMMITDMIEKNGQIKVVGERKGKKYTVNITDIEYNDDIKGSEWIEAYKSWNEGRW